MHPDRLLLLCQLTQGEFCVSELENLVGVGQPSLGYAVLAGLPPVYGLYAAIVPVIVYAWIGSSSVQAVGPVAITAIMTASSLHPYASQGVQQYALMASLLSLMVGTLLWLAGRLKLGWIMQFISRGVYCFLIHLLP